RTLKQANTILVLADGRIVQRGTHDELVAQPGLYRRIYDLQLRDQEDFGLQATHNGYRGATDGPARSAVSAQGERSEWRPVPHPPDPALGATASAQGEALPQADQTAARGVRQVPTR